MFNTSAPTAFASFRLVSKASYTATLLVVLKFGRREYFRITPSPLLSIFLTPTPFYFFAPSMCIIHSDLLSATFFSRFSMPIAVYLFKKSVDTCPIFPILGLISKLYPTISNTHFVTRPVISCFYRIDFRG